MIYGNMTLNSRPDQDDMKEGICSHCLEQTTEVARNESFDDHFGTVTDWSVGSECCGEEILEGSIFLDKTSSHIARKDHLSAQGDILIPKGSPYTSSIVKGFYVAKNGLHKPILKYSKRLK